MADKKKIIISIILIIILGLAFVIYMIIDNRSYNEMSFNELIIENETEDKNILIINEVKNDQEEIAVHIIGEVKKEGIIYLPKGARIIDAIEEAGGETEEADLSQVNLAYELQDGQKIYIPNKNEQISEYITSNSGNNVIIEGNSSQNQKEGENEKVNINTANQTELDSLPGIGASIAQRIIEYREENGNFKSIEELQNVKGIGDSKYADIKDKITI